jgi:hypothetical protein
MADSDDIDMSGWTHEQREEWRLNELIGPLFDLFLRFEKAFSRLAIDRYDISDEDAEAAAQLLLKSDDDKCSMGPAFVYFLRHVKMQRIFRQLAHRFEAVKGEGEGLMRIDEIHERYRKLEEQGKVGKA